MYISIVFRYNKAPTRCLFFVAKVGDTFIGAKIVDRRRGFQPLKSAAGCRCYFSIKCKVKMKDANNFCPVCKRAIRRMIEGRRDWLNRGWRNAEDMTPNAEDMTPVAIYYKAKPLPQVVVPGIGSIQFKKKILGLPIPKGPWYMPFPDDSYSKNIILKAIPVY